MACCRQHCSKAGALYCRCGAAFCSEACYIASWHAGHKEACPHAPAILDEVAVPAPGKRRASQTAMLCGAALARQRPVAGVPPQGEEQDPKALACKRCNSEREEECAPVRSTLSCQSTVAGVSAGTPSFAGSTSTEDSEQSSAAVLEKFWPAGCSLEDFTAEFSDLGSGAFGTVRKVVHKQTGDIFAMKSVPKQKILENQMTRHLMSEVRTQLLVQHPHIVRLFHYFEDAQHVHLLLEFADEGNLFRHLQRRGRLPEEDAARIFLGVAGALEHLHRRKIVHRDVKPENILLAGGEAKLADFGWCAELVADQSRQTFCGTWDYLSPEMISGDAHDHAVDVWAMGVLLYEMLLGKPPFAAKSTAASLKRIESVDLQFPEDFPEGARDLIARLLVRAPQDRLDLGSARQHPWVRQALARKAPELPRPVPSLVMPRTRREAFEQCYRPGGCTPSTSVGTPSEQSYSNSQMSLLGLEQAPELFPETPAARSPSTARSPQEGSQTEAKLQRALAELKALETVALGSPATASSRRAQEALLQRPRKEQLKSLEMDDDDEAEIQELAPPVTKSYSSCSHGHREQQPPISPSQSCPLASPRASPMVSPRTLPTLHTSWKTTTAFAAVNAFVKEDASSMPATTPRRRDCPELGLSGTGRSRGGHDDLSLSSYLDSTLRASPLEETSRQLAPIRETEQRAGADCTGSRAARGSPLRARLFDVEY